MNSGSVGAAELLMPGLKQIADDYGVGEVHVRQESGSHALVVSLTRQNRSFVFTLDYELLANDRFADITALMRRACREVGGVYGEELQRVIEQEVGRLNK